MASTAVDLDPLRPELIGAVFGRRPSPLHRGPITALQPRSILLAVGAVALFGIFLVAAATHQLLEEAAPPSALQLLPRVSGGLTGVRLPLWQDPEGVVFLVVAFATPLFCAEQVRGLRRLVSMNLANLGPQAHGLDTARINAEVAIANRGFDRIGRRAVSAGIAVGAGLFAVALMVALDHNGLLASWAPDGVVPDRWRRMVYDGWWANWRRQPVLALAWWGSATCFGYFLTKQLWMGFVFARFARAARSLQFSVVPNVAVDTDGYHGLRPLRRFMQWTYGSTLSHFVVTLGFWFFWLPFGQWSIFVIIVVMIINCVVVIYPSVLAYHGALRTKMDYVESVRSGSLPADRQQEAIDRVWSTPHLPFRVRSALTAISIYLLIPVLLAVLSQQ